MIYKPVSEYEAEVKTNLAAMKASSDTTYILKRLREIKKLTQYMIRQRS